MRPRQVSDKQILNAARSCFLEHGFSVSTQLIANKLGVSQATLFKRFGTKESLFLESLRPPHPLPLVVAMEQGPDDRPLKEQLLELAQQVAITMDRVLPRIMVIKASGIPPERVHASQRCRHPSAQARQALKTWFQRAQQRGLARPIDPQTAADTFLGALQMRVFQASIDEQPLIPAEQYAAALVDTLWRGLAPEETP